MYAKSIESQKKVSVKMIRSSEVKPQRMLRKQATLNSYLEKQAVEQEPVNNVPPRGSSISFIFIYNCLYIHRNPPEPRWKCSGQKADYQPPPHDFPS